MMSLVTTFTGADTNSARMKRLVREAADYGLEYHRRRYLPLHFKAVANVRYGKAYSKHGVAKRSRRAGMSRKASRSGLRVVDPKNQIPLVYTGLLKSKVLQGGAKVSGRFDKRKIKYSAPYYTFINVPGSINKLDALKAVTSAEEQDVYQKAQDYFTKQLNAKQTRKRG